MWCLGTWFGGRFGSAWLVVGLDDLRGLDSKQRSCNNLKQFLMESDVDQLLLNNKKVYFAIIK